MTTKIQGKVKAISGPREHEGVLQMGFILEADEKKWYNISGEKSFLEELLKIIKKGAEISFDYDSNKNITNLKMIKEPEKGKEGSWADDITNFETLLKDAHKKFPGKLEIRTEILQDGNGSPLIDFEKKRAVFKATVTADGNLFEGHGETTSENISGDTAKSWLRIAETRSIVRALRWATNNAKVAEEEIPEGQNNDSKAESETKKSQS